ncbi:hypothetical protein T03_8079 [Trichinella britovi]|uniref:Uncharacterized protein n=1 Tax=Trichinella britovi TaxID=45882 RepID=A0A0V1CUQ1_TRIBR|nr:hypothetical protein T03_8079 [Trichinella britovi]KRZ89648.1 hypothetical protein T08_4875 [Trichinella sp. T8]
MLMRIVKLFSVGDASADGCLHSVGRSSQSSQSDRFNYSSDSVLPWNGSCGIGKPNKGNIANCRNLAPRLNSASQGNAAMLNVQPGAGSR